jgi:hypothetical protein
MVMKTRPSGYGSSNQNLRAPCASYSATDGRPVSSLAERNGRGSPSTTHAENLSAQVPDKWARDTRAVQGRTPVRDRPFTQKHEG